MVARRRRVRLRTSASHTGAPAILIEQDCAVRVAASIFALLVAVALFVLWALVGIVRVSNCGPAEGGGSCSPSAFSWLLLAGAIVAAISAVLALALPRRRQ